MTIEEARDIIEKMCFKVAINSPVQDALIMADMALQNQSKYENALERAADYINDCDDCPVKECGGITSGENMDECPKKIISAWKRKAGIEVADNENE